MSNKKTFNILFVGDVVGNPGLDLCNKIIPGLKEKENIDFVIINGENSAKEGRGLNQDSVNSMLESGADVITSGNHVWKHDKFMPALDKATNIIRPINFPATTPGKGYCIINKGGVMVAVINAMGRVFFREHTNCPFREMDSILTFLKGRVDIILFDFHAEATAEKQAMAFYLDGRIHAQVGTHTHVQTADNRIMPKGTAYISDLGFSGAINSCLGMSFGPVINHQLSQMPARFKVELEGPFVFCGAILKMEKADSGKWVNQSFERVMIEA